MPPMLYVTFFELVRAGANNLCPGHGGTAVDKGHHVLQLIAETISATRLIAGSAGPDAAGKSLIEKPTVEHRVQGCIRSFYFDRPQQLVPVSQHLFEGIVDVATETIAGRQVFCFFDRFCLTQKKNNLACFVGRQLDGCLQRGAGIMTSSCSTSQAHPAQRRRLLKLPIASDEFLPVTGGTRHLFTGSGKGNASSKLVVERIARKDRGVLFIDLGDDVGRSGSSLYS